MLILAGDRQFASQRAHILCRPLVGETTCRELERFLEAVRRTRSESLCVAYRLKLYPL